MDNLTFIRTLGKSVCDGDLQSVNEFVTTHRKRLETEMMSETSEKRVLDYQLIAILLFIENNDVAYKLCKYFLENGADVNVNDYQQAVVGPINKAAERNLELVKLFHEHGGNINHDLYGLPGCWPLISAVVGNEENLDDSKGSLEIVKYLVENGAVVNFVNNWGRSPLDYADDQPEIYEYLKSVGAKPGSELPSDHLKR